MTRADDVHDLPSPTVLEQITRWAVADEWSGRGPADYAADAVHAASEGSPEHFRMAVADLAEHDGPGSRAAVLQATLWGNVDATLPALADNKGLRALLRIAAQQAEGRDVAEIATPTGLRLGAEQTGETYETAVLVEDVPGRSDVLASATITAATATEALRTAAEREHAVLGLDNTDLQMVNQQLARLHQLADLSAAASPYTGNCETYELVRQQRQLDIDVANGQYRVFAEALESDEQWADLTAHVTGRDLRGEPGWSTLAATRSRGRGRMGRDQAPARRRRASAPADARISKPRLGLPGHGRLP